MFDFSKLRGRIKQILGSESIFAEKINLSPASLSYTFNGKRYFSAIEIYIACSKDVLDIPIDEIGDYFFNKKLELNSREK